MGREPGTQLWSRRTKLVPGTHPAFHRRGPGTAEEADEDTRTSAPHRGAGFGIVQERPLGTALRPAQCHTGLPRESALQSALPATRQAAGVPSAGSQPSQSTHERPRRWCDAGPLGPTSQRPRRPGPKEPAPGQRPGQHPGQRQDSAGAASAAGLGTPSADHLIGQGRGGAGAGARARTRKRTRAGGRATLTAMKAAIFDMDGLHHRLGTPVAARRAGDLRPRGSQAE